MVACSHRGELLEAKSICQLGNINLELAEAMGVREALGWVKANRWPMVEVETECLLIVQSIRSEAVKLLYLGRIVDKC